MKSLRGWEFDEMEEKSSPTKKRNSYHFSLDILIPGERHLDVAAEVIKVLPSLRGNLLYDAQTAILMREHGIKRIYTRDMDFHRFPFLEPADPSV